MRDHRSEMTAEEREADRRLLVDITDRVAANRRTGISTEERRRRKAKRTQQAQARRNGRRK